jgi:hypothetical protein
VHIEWFVAAKWTTGDRVAYPDALGAIMHGDPPDDDYGLAVIDAEDGTLRVDFEEAERLRRAVRA